MEASLDFYYLKIIKRLTSENNYYEMFVVLRSLRNNTYI